MQPNPQQQVRNVMSRMEEKDKAGVPKEDFETARDIATDSIPGVSETKDIISLSSNIGKGDYVGAGIDATALALGAFPILGDVARQGFKRITKQLRDKDIKEAKNLIGNDIAAEKWKEANKLAEQQRQKRNPKIQKEVDKLSQGLTTSKKYRSVVKSEQPIKPITKNNFPEMPTKTDIVGALKATDPRKISTGIIGINKKIEDGTRVGSRLDIPSYDNYDKWIVSLHDGTKKGGNAIGYGQTALLKNVEFVSSAKGGLNIAKGKPKATIARIHGDYYNAEPELVYESAKKLIANPEWTQVGMNPFKHSYFYNKETGMPVTRADEVIQVGPLVLAKGVKKPTISELKELKIKTQDGKIRMFNEGGTTMKKQMEMFEDGGLKDEGGMIDEVSGNDVPSGSTREEVRDDIPAQLSEGEFVFPADVVRYIGLEKLMMMRQEAKQGLKQMEAMGQMGNSDEATMPDDLPFDETDLDMEDELEYNRGGVIEAQQGTYVAPTVPTGSQPLGTNPMGNPMGVPQQVADGVSNVARGTPYTPDVSKMYGAGATPYAPVSYNQLLGPSATGAPTTETVRYFNAATGQTRMIPHLVNADGSRGATLYPVPEGFVIQEEAPKEEAKKTTKVQSTQVQQQQDDGGDSEPRDTSTKDPSGISYNRSTLQSEELKSLFDKVGVFSGLSILNPSLNIARSAMGKGNVASASNAALGGIIDGFRGGDVNYFGTNERNTGLQSGTYDNNKSLNSLSFEEQSQIGRVGSVVFSSVIDPMIYDTDANGKKTARSDADIRKSAIDKAKELELNITIPNTNIALRTETIIREIAKKEYEKQAQADTAFDVSQRATTEEDSVYGDTVDRGVGAGVGFNVGSGNDYDPSDDGPSASADSYDSSQDTSFEGSYEDDDMYNKGGLAGKKKTPKPKKMKRGGLASR